MFLHKVYAWEVLFEVPLRMKVLYTELDVVSLFYALIS